MIDASLITAAIGACAGIAGAGVTHWFGLQRSRLDARQQLRLIVRKERMQAKADIGALQREKREAFLGHVLTAQNRILDLTDSAKFRHLPSESDAGRSGPKQSHANGLTTKADELPSHSARQAYALALLYLHDLSDASKRYAYATAQVEMTFLRRDFDASEMKEWRSCFDEIEKLLGAGS